MSGANIGDDDACQKVNNGAIDPKSFVPHGMKIIKKYLIGDKLLLDGDDVKRKKTSLITLSRCNKSKTTKYMNDET